MSNQFVFHTPVIRMFLNHIVMTKSTICVSVCLMAGWCLLLPVYHCIGVIAISGTCFQLSYSFTPPLPPIPAHLSLLPPSLLPPTPSASFSFSSSLASPPPPPGRSGLAASYLSVKALVPQMPKLLKSLFPARDEKKELRPSPHNQQVSTDNEVERSAAQETNTLTNEQGGI